MTLRPTVLEPTSYPVQVGNHIFATHQVRGKNRTAGAESVLLAAKKAKLICYCLCQSDCPHPLFIKGGNEEEVDATDGQAKKSRKKQAVHLCAYPGTGPRHLLDCPFWSTALPTPSFNEAAIKEDTNGTANVSVDISLAVTTRGPGSPLEGEEVRENESAHQNRIGVLGLLYYLLERSGLNRHGPGNKRRTRQSVFRAMQVAAGDITINKNPLYANLHLPGNPDTHYPNTDAFRLDWQEARTMLEQTQKSGGSRRILVVGEIQSIKSTEAGDVLRLSGLDEPIHPGAFTHIRLSKSFPSPMAALRERVVPPKRPVMIIALVSLDETGKLLLKDYCLCMFSRDWIPVASLLEALVAEKLVNEGRRFRKPMRRKNSTDVLHDFILEDVRPEWPMEVIGMTGHPEYDAAQEKKAAKCKRDGIEFWAWRPKETDVIPDFPEATLARDEAKLRPVQVDV